MHILKSQNFEPVVVTFRRYGRNIWACELNPADSKHTIQIYTGEYEFVKNSHPQWQDFGSEILRNDNISRCGKSQLNFLVFSTFCVLFRYTITKYGISIYNRRKMETSSYSCSDRAIFSLASRIRSICLVPSFVAWFSNHTSS